MPKKLKTMDIKRKNKSGQEVKVGEYVTVNERVKAFHDLYPKGNIETQMISDESGTATMKAIVIPNIEVPARFFTGYAKEKEENGWINKTDCLENCETSAVGRALGFLGIGIDQAIATVEDIKTAMKAYSGIEVPRALPSETESKEEARVIEPEINDVPEPKPEPQVSEESNTEQSEAISKEKMAKDKEEAKIRARKLVEKAKSNGYTQPEMLEIIGLLGYDMLIDVSGQDYDTIMEEVSKSAASYREKKELLAKESKSA